MLRAFLCVALYLSISSHSYAHTINWLTHDFAPYYILNGKYQHQGRDESVITLLEQQLPHVTFKRVVIPSGRAIQELANKSATHCALSLYKNEFRKSFIHFSEHSSTTGLSPSIAMHKGLAKSLGVANGKAVSLHDLLAEKKLTLGVSMNRSYGEALDKVINNTPDINIVIRPTRNSLASLTYMLNLKRLDILLGYPSEHHYLAKSMYFEENLTQRAIVEAPPLSYGYIGCTKNEQGAKNIQLLDEQLKKIKQTEQYHQVMLRWLPEHLKPLLESRVRSTKNNSTQN